VGIAPADESIRFREGWGGDAACFQNYLESCSVVDTGSRREFLSKGRLKYELKVGEGEFQRCACRPTCISEVDIQSGPIDQAYDINV